MLYASLFEKLHSDYPGDVGCFGIYFFNYITLQPGEAIYLGANEPHAYLYGGQNYLFYNLNFYYNYYYVNVNYTIIQKVKFKLQIA